MPAVLPAPVADWVTPGDLVRDPYPVYERLRREAPVAWVPRLNRYFVTTFADCFRIEMDQQTFSSHEDGSRSTMVRTMGGRPMLRKDDPEHKTERSSFGASLRPKTIKLAWHRIFEQNADRYIRQMRDAGPGVDLHREFSVPFAADNLTAVLGLQAVPAATMMNWSHTLIAGISNVTDDPEVWRRTAQVTEELENCIADSAAYLRKNPGPSMLSAMVNAAEPIDDEAIAANLKLAISGGMNEPSHVISGAAWELMRHPQQLAAVRTGERSWADVFEETARYHSPVGMYPRIATKDAEVAGVLIPAGSTVAVVIGSANRDEDHFERASVFDIFRESTTNLAFGNGTHICAGNWVARDMVGAAALPRLFDAFPDLAPVDPASVEFSGWVFRGTDSLPVTWGGA